MDKRRFAITAAVGCGIILLLLVALVPLAIVLGWMPLISRSTDSSAAVVTVGVPSRVEPTLTVPPTTPEAVPPPEVPRGDSSSWETLYDQAAPGVVSIQVYTVRQGQLAGRGAGSGFLLDEQGHVITNNHVVANADIVTVFYHDGFETEAQIIGTDQDSDLAVIKVDTLHEGTHPLPLGDSEAVQVGEPVAAIGNPFGQQSSISAGIVSATGRTIPTGVTPFAIPQAIQTDAAINPGNSGGPLLNLEGEVIGVNAQIATSGTGVSAGVGFAIPSNVVRRVIPVLIEKGEYAWPWLGVRGGPVSLALQQAMNLPDQQGAYLHEIISGGPADRAGLQGSSETAQFHGMDFPAGGDIVRGINGTPIEDFNDLLVEVAFRQPGEEVELTVLRGDETLRVDVTLAPRPASFQSEGSP